MALLWQGKVTILDGDGGGIDYKIENEIVLMQKKRVAELMHEQMEKLVCSLAFKCDGCLNGHEHNPTVTGPGRYSVDSVLSVTKQSDLTRRRTAQQ